LESAAAKEKTTLNCVLKPNANLPKNFAAEMMRDFTVPLSG